MKGCSLGEVDAARVSGGPGGSGTGAPGSGDTDEARDGAGVAGRSAVEAHARLVGLVAGADALLCGVVQRVHASGMAARRLAEHSLMGEVPGGVLEPPSAKRLVLPAVGEPGLRGGDVDAGAGALDDPEPGRLIPEGRS